MNDRHDPFAQAKDLLGDARLTAFLRAAADDRDCHVLAVKLINDRLDRGESLTAIFADQGRSFEEGYGFQLSATPTADSAYHVEFGCQVSPDAGDGGCWGVAFDGDAVRSIAIESIWVWVS